MYGTCERDCQGTMLQTNGVFNSYRLTPQGNFQPSFVIDMGGRQDHDILAYGGSVC
jgi:hypothetical protein